MSRSDDVDRAHKIMMALDRNPTGTLNAFAGLLWCTLGIGVALGLGLGWVILR